MQYGGAAPLEQGTELVGATRGGDPDGEPGERPVQFLAPWLPAPLFLARLLLARSLLGQSMIVLHVVHKVSSRVRVT